MKHQNPEVTLSCRIASALLGLPLAAGALFAQDATPPETPAKSDGKPETPAEEPAKQEEEAAKTEEAETKDESGGELKNWVEFGVGGSIISGHTPAYQQRYGLPQDALGGIQGFHFEEVFGKDGTLSVDGRAIFDNADYRADIGYIKENVGYVKTGYSSFRTWYDPSGGYFPPSQTWFNLYPDATHTDNDTIYAEVGLRMPKLPEATIRYERGRVEGQKDSTIWGQTSMTGGLGPRGLVPAKLDLDRVRDLIAVDLAKSFSTTKVGLGVRLEKQDNQDATLLRQYPDQSNDRRITQQNNSDADMVNVHGSVEQKLSSKVKLTAGYGYTDLNTDISGYRVSGQSFDPDYAQRVPEAGTYEGLRGGSKLRQNVGNLNLLATLADKLFLVPSLKVEGRTWDGDSLYTQPAQPFFGSTYEAMNDRSLLDVSEALDLRYTGVTNWVFYARGQWLQGSGDLSETTRNVDTDTTVETRETDDTRAWQKYSAGANWYPHRRVSVGAEYYHKQRDSDYDHTLDSTPNLAPAGFRYSAYINARNLTTDDVNVRLTWRPRGNLTFVGRGDLQWSTLDSQMDGLSRIQTAEMTSYIVSGSASWVPWNRLYLQGTISQVWDATETPASDMTLAVQDAENDYLTASTTAGYALDDKTDLEAQFLYYLATNYDDNATSGMAYGADAQNIGVTVGVVRRMSPRVRLSLKYGFFDNQDSLYGGHRDYTAHLIYSTVSYRF